MPLPTSAAIYIAGHRGMVGSAIVRRLQALGYTNLITATHAELDLTNQAAVRTFFASQRIDHVVLAAAKVGGIHANSDKLVKASDENSGHLDKAKSDSAAGYVFHRQGKKSSFLKEMAEYAMRYGEAGLPQLLEFLKNPDWEVRCAGLRAVGLIEGKKSKEILMGYIQDGVSVEEAAQAALALGGMEDPDVTPLLLGKIGEIKKLFI